MRLKIALASIIMMISSLFIAQPAKAGTPGTYAVNVVYCGGAQGMAYYSSEIDVLQSYTGALRRMVNSSSDYKSVAWMVADGYGSYRSIVRVNIDPADYCPWGAASPVLVSTYPENEFYPIWNQPAEIAIVTTYCGGTTAAPYYPWDRATGAAAWARAVQRQVEGNQSNVAYMKWFDFETNATSASDCH